MDYILTKRDGKVTMEKSFNFLCDTILISPSLSSQR